MREGQARRNQNADHQATVDWLTQVDYGSQQSDFISRRQTGTGQWLLDSAEFQNWAGQAKQTLLCLGLPGVGKTMVTSIIVDHLWSKYLDDPSIGIGYVYCNFRRQNEQRTIDILASLLKQLILARPSIPKSLARLYESHKDKGTRPSKAEILAEVHSVVAEFQRCFILIDALDECDVSNGILEELMSEIFKLQAVTQANLFATSRHIPHIRGQFCNSPSLELRASETDVRRYIEGQMPRLPKFVLKSTELQEEIKAQIVRKTDGMYVYMGFDRRGQED